MNDTTPLPPLPTSAEAGAKELAEERRRIDKRDWWVRGYSIFVILLLTFAVISLALPAVLTGAETFFNIKLTEAVFGLITLIVLFNIYTIYQEILIRRLSAFELDWQGQKIPVTFSAGWKDYEMGDRPEEMLARADEALYASKRATKKPKAATKPITRAKT